MRPRAHRTRGMPTLATRSFNNYGPHEYPKKLIPFTIQKTLAGEPIAVYGGGCNVCDRLYVEGNSHVISAVLRLNTFAQVYNVGGGGNDLSNTDLIHLLLHTLAEQTGKLERTIPNSSPSASTVQDTIGDMCWTAGNCTRTWTGWQERLSGSCWNDESLGCSDREATIERGAGALASLRDGSLGIGL